MQGGLAERADVSIEDSPTDFSRTRTFLGAGVDYGWSRRDSIGISFGVGRSDYAFDNTSGSNGLNPWDRIAENRVSLTGRWGFADKGSLIVIPSWRQTAESGASTSDSQTAGLLTAAFWEVTETLTIGPGIGVFSRLEDSARVFPILAIDWDISSRWNLSTGRGLAATRGPGLTLSYQLSPTWRMELAGRYEEVEFRLDDDGIAAGGIGRDRSIPVVLSTRYQPAKNFELSAFVGTELNGELGLYDESGNEIMEKEYGSGLLLGATFRYRY